MTAAYDVYASVVICDSHARWLFIISKLSNSHLLLTSWRDCCVTNYVPKFAGYNVMYLYVDYDLTVTDYQLQLAEYDVTVSQEALNKYISVTQLFYKSRSRVRSLTQLLL